MSETPTLTPSGTSWLEKNEKPVSASDATNMQLLSIESGRPESGSLNGFGTGSPQM